MTQIKRIIWFGILVFIILNLSVFIVSRKSYFLKKFDPEYFGQLYTNSQYVIGDRSIGGIGDDGLYAFAGYYYFFQKGDVTSVNFEHPPLGKYLIGLSIYLFQNENVINLVYYFLLMITTYFLALKLTKNKIISIVSVFILSINPLLLDHLIRSQLDLPFTLFFTLAFYYFLRSLEKHKLIFISSLFWGLAFATRFFPALIPIQVFFLYFIVRYERKILRSYLISLFIIPVIYLLAHISFFIYHPSLQEFIRHKIWMLSWYRGSPISPGNIWRNIFTGDYFDPAGKLVANEHWNVRLPVIITLSLIPFFQKKAVQQLPIRIAYYLNLLFLLYVTFFTTGVQKYIIPVYPITSILAVRSLSFFWCIIDPCVKVIISKSKVKS